jgi:hypothetical protein
MQEDNLKQGGAVLSDGLTEEINPVISTPEQTAEEKKTEPRPSKADIIINLLSSIERRLRKHYFIDETGIAHDLEAERLSYTVKLQPDEMRIYFSFLVGSAALTKFWLDVKEIKKGALENAEKMGTKIEYINLGEVLTKNYNKDFQTELKIAAINYTINDIFKNGFSVLDQARIMNTCYLAFLDVSAYMYKRQETGAN